MAKQNTEVKVVTDKSRVASILENSLADFLNGVEEVDYKVSTGSLIFDRYINLGFGPGIVRFAGAYESGKTSAALNCLEDFLTKERPFKRKGVFIRSEGRLDPEIKGRYNIKFVKSAADWEEGTCLEVLSNKYEPVFGLIKELIINNPEDIKYFIILDSVDALISKGDADKSFEDSTKVAGGAVITSNFLKQLALDIKVRGHLFLPISQVRADIRLQYSSAPMKDNFSGGNALLHAADWICEFRSVNAGDRILTDEKAKYDPIKNPYIGHNAKVALHKTTNQKTDSKFEFPIKYGIKKGNAVWNSREALPMLLGWGDMVRKGGWYYLSDSFVKSLKDYGIEAPEKLQGEDAVLEFIEENPKAINLIKDRLYLIA